ncbi:MAG: aspartate carbamoyltransferase catalytic subunit [Acidobacteriota bacterium]
MSFSAEHLLSIEDLSPDDITLILDTAEEMDAVSQRPVKKVPALRGRTIMNLFFEASTRTRASFELAGKRLSADMVNFSTSTSSVKKGETLLDTARTLEAMQPDMVVVRHQSAGAASYLAERMHCRVVNAGDGAHQHPTQALLDAFTMRRHFGRLEGLKVLIGGDFTHSRVVRSNVQLLTKMGAKVTACAPPSMMPPDAERFGIDITSDFDAALPGSDVVMMLRCQFERHGVSMFPSAREYFKHFGLTMERLALAKSNAIVMHPGPMNRGVEIASEVADHERSVILDQVQHGVAVRMAVLFLVFGGGDRRVEAEA